MKKTKIICTMGPNTNDKELLKALAIEGMDIARFNFSHGDHEEQKGRMDMIKSLRAELQIPLAILLDTKGPEIRTGLLKNEEKVNLKEGDAYTFTSEEIIGDETRSHITYANLAEDLSVGNKILVDDGLLEFEVTEIAGKEIKCRVVNGGELGMRKGVNVPNVQIKLPGITEKDKEDIIFGIGQGIDFIAASFVRSADCIKEIKEILKEHKAEHIQVIAKIENAEGIANIDEIIKYSDGIMVARGDLGVEIPAHELPYLQKMIIKKCNEQYKPVITATQMLDSMMRNPRPTRAEVTDVANAIYDGTDAVMLSGETAAGKYPLEAIRMMVQIAKSTEQHLDYERLIQNKAMHRKKGIESAVGYSTVAISHNLDVKLIVNPTVSGATARLVSSFRPSVPIVGISPNEETVRKMQIYWGVTPILSEAKETTEDIIARAIDIIKDRGYVQKGDTVVLTAGSPAPTREAAAGAVSNMMRVSVID
ncbi:pyruvate kinase [Konateibacter massiliensis]|uniref:pyruvate kinase n=1 Tax=Konateibacter massiliensis TaxID=2002841 RepID=UPI000C14C2BA|nr:pyruvate kinase [Konateibacter massiliensis]